MELRTLRYYLAAAEEENITRAADILHITQPTLSRQLMDLEKELGVTLMIRGKNGLTLTDDGIFFRQRAEEIVELADRLEQAFMEKSADVSGVISIGATESVGSRLLARFIRQFSEKYPHVQFSLYNEMADYIKDRLDKGLLDVGLLLEPVDTSKYDFVRLSQKEIWGVLMRDDHPLACRESIAPDEVADYPLILPLRERVRAEILNWLNREEKDLVIPLSYTLLSNAVLLVEEGLGCAFCLDGALAIHSSPRLRFIPIHPEHTTRSVLVWKKNCLFSPAASLFIQEINMLRAGIEKKLSME
ncbi:MAG TPA: LysR family transcriptional regulator [Candidatus Eisenbergiella merdipullorum]|uniref:LysR family transcriptional regulator n=1 Tax=Candidatus Eisenbergiella merdipullorum TaxID=2838553 RepID=A0A9D2L1L7_9FIRM|nr:LysR family transcriptional regulator [Candidatus Eisenbergiella merdipullorum]